MKTLRETINEAQKGKYAIGHFNVANIEMVQAIVNAAKDVRLPVIIGASEGERDAFGVKELVALVKTLREDTEHDIYLNADHTYSVERVKEAIDAGFDSVIFDGAQLSFEENIAKTKECVAYAQSKGDTTLVEGELGFIGVGSQLLDVLPVGAAVTDDMMTTAEDAKRFVDETGVDLLAPAVGTIHGTLKSGMDPRLNPSRVKEIADAVSIPLVLHGGSGTSDEDYLAVIVSGIAQVHVSTELRVAYRKALQISLQENTEELAPYKYTKQAVLAVQDIVEKRLKLFAGR
ncbi:MAG: class II fructose-bisphosphate aldolase [Candidatus Campbellbacteria bacterium]|nr:class II fructose-bisphosphate aldolase [Candidatus Campbellbacteria bacterium]